MLLCSIPGAAAGSRLLCVPARTNPGTNPGWSWSLEFCGCIPELEELFAQGEPLEISFPLFWGIFWEVEGLWDLVEFSSLVVTQEWDTPFFQEKGQVEVAKLLM